MSTVQKLAKQASDRDKKTAKEEKTLTKNHKSHVTNAPTPSKVDKGFKNTRAEVGPSTGNTIAPPPAAPSSSLSGKPKNATSVFSSSKSSGKDSSSSSASGKKFCAGCGIPRGTGNFCAGCGAKL